jgi:hypothetical protein
VEKERQKELHNFCQNTERNRGESYFEKHYRTGSSPWFREIEMNGLAFVSINRMRGGHSSLKTSLSRFNVVSTTEFECDDGLQMEEYVFWDCKLYEDQRATTMDILSEKSNNE